MHSDTYICYKCGEDIVDHVYQVQRRRIRKIPVDAPATRAEKVKLGILFDAVDPSHGGVILGPEFDDYCPTCFKNLPSIEELIKAHKTGLQERESNENT